LAAPELDLTFVDRMVSEFVRGREAAIPLLQAIQLTIDTCRMKLCAASAS